MEVCHPQVVKDFGIQFLSHAHFLVSPLPPLPVCLWVNENVYLLVLGRIKSKLPLSHLEDACIQGDKEKKPTVG